MSISHSPLLKSEAPVAPMAHLHHGDEQCPFCDQLIPHDRFEEIKERIEARRAADLDEVRSLLKAQFAQEKAEALELSRRQAESVLKEHVLRAREEERQAAEAAAGQKLAEAERANHHAQAALQARLEQTERAKVAAEQASNALHLQLQQVRLHGEAAVERVKADAAAKAATIREEAKREAELAVQEQLAELTRARQKSEAALEARIVEVETTKTSLQEANATLLVQLDQVRADGEQVLAKAKAEAEARAEAVRLETVAKVHDEVREQLAVAEQAKEESQAKAVAAEERARIVTETHDGELAARLQEQREILEKAKTDAVNAEKSAAFEEKLKLTSKVEELQRTLDNKTAEELGEGAEIDLYEALKAEFEDDKIERINKGQPGADILHTVVRNGKECGSILYDSKNHNAWRNEFVTKLAKDQMAAKADHAVLCSRKLPAGARQLHVQDNVILANPARVIALVRILRTHLVDTHTLRMSNEERTKKTAALYDFITSQRCRDLLGRIDTQAETLLDLQIKEQKAHDAMWKKQGELYRNMQKVRAEISNEIDIIVGTADEAE